MRVEISHELQEGGDRGGDDREVDLRLCPYNERSLSQTRIACQSGSVEGRQANSYSHENSDRSCQQLTST